MLPGVPAGLLFLLLLAPPFSDNAKAGVASEEESTVLSNMGGVVWESYNKLRKTNKFREPVAVRYSTAGGGEVCNSEWDFSFIRWKKDDRW